jgi:hypothetical protein
MDLTLLSIQKKARKRDLWISCPLFFLVFGYSLIFVLQAQQEPSPRFLFVLFAMNLLMFFLFIVSWVRLQIIEESIKIIGILSRNGVPDTTQWIKSRSN